MPFGLTGCALEHLLRADAPVAPPPQGPPLPHVHSASLDQTEAVRREVAGACVVAVPHDSREGTELKPASESPKYRRHGRESLVLVGEPRTARSPGDGPARSGRDIEAQVDGVDREI